MNPRWGRISSFISMNETYFKKLISEYPQLTLHEINDDGQHYLCATYPGLLHEVIQCIGSHCYVTDTWHVYHDVYKDGTISIGDEPDRYFHNKNWAHVKKHLDRSLANIPYLLDKIRIEKEKAGIV